MKMLTRIAAATVFVAFTGSALAEVYSVYVKRVDENLYKTSEGFYIETQYCYHYTYGEDAILKYEQYSYSNKLIFDDGESCDVKRVFK
jgi:hypothetical protein